MNANDQDSIGTDGKSRRDRKPPKGKMDFEDFDDDDQGKDSIRMILSWLRAKGDLLGRRRRMRRKINSRLMITSVMIRSRLANRLRGEELADSKAQLRGTITKKERTCLKTGTA
jgi:hypothetical protein